MSRKFKILAICAFLALSIMLPALFVASPAEAAKWGNFEYEIIDGEITITKGPSRDAIVVIPAEIDGVPVTSIGKNAFYDNSRIQSVTIPDSIRVIGESAFNYCVSLEPVTIPEGVTTIGLRAFTNCRAMTSISIPDSVTIIEKEAFSNCWAMTSISIPYGITSLEDSLFYGCYNLTSVTIPDTVTSINKFAFNLCTSLESITIPDGVTTIGENAFRNCTSLESITIPDGVSTISETTFLNCTSLGFITIPDGVTSIGKEAFRDCTSLEYIAIPGTVTSIGADAFRNCISLEDFDVSSSNSHFKSEDGVLFNKAGTTLIQYPAGLGDVSYAIPPGTISIGAGAFRDCSHLESITIIDSVTSIGSEAFFGCSSLRAFNVSPSHPSYTSIDGVLFNKAGTTLIQYPAGLSDASYAIPDDVTSIQGGAFFECGHLESVTVPDSVTQIGRGAFNNTSPSLNIYFTGNAPSVTSNQLSNRATITAWWYEGSTGFPHMAKWAGVYSAMLEAPAAPVDLTLTPLYGGAILSWGAPDYNGGFDAFRYLVYVDDALVKTVADRTCELSLSVGESTISVKAENDIGIGEGASALLTLGWDLSITLPSDGDMLRPGPVTVEWAYSESAGIIDSFQVLANGEETDLDGDARSADLILKVDSYTVEVRAIDVNGDYISEQISFVVSADYDDGTFEYTLTGDYGDGPAVITGYSGPGGDVVIPEALDGKPVEAIGATAFQGDDDIVTVTVPSTVLEIGEEAFSGCSSLTDVYFLGDAPTVGGGLISDNSELIAWHFAGAEDFTTSLWMGVKIQVLNPPTAPQGLDLAPSYGGVTLTWEAPDDDGSLPVEFYIVQVDGVEVGTLTDTTLWLELDASEHSIGVTAGNRLIFGPEASGIVDLSRELEITGHSGDSPIRPGAVTIHWSYDESSSMVDHFLVILDGVEQQLPANARSHELTLKVGERVIKVEAVDSRGGSIFDQTVLMVSADYGDGTFEYALTGEMGDGPAVITSYVGIGRDVTVPATLGGKPVETIEASAFQGNDDIIIVRIPASVTHMGEGAFSGCGSLTDVLFLGDAPAVGGDRLSDDAGLMAWFQEGAEDFTTPS